MEQKQQIQWHPLYYAALPMDFSDDRDILEFRDEFPLNELAVKADTIIIKKDADKKTRNEIGAIFRGHNIIEFKSAKDSADINSWLKVTAYAGLYVSNEKRVGNISFRDVTITLIREAKPVKLFDILEKEYGCTTEQPYPGIYYIRGAALFPSQIVVIRELENTHPFLKMVSPDGANISQIVQLFQFRRDETDRSMIERASSLFSFIFERHPALYATFEKEHQDMTHPAVLAYFAEDFKAQEEKIAELESKLFQKDQALSQKDQALSQKDQALSQKEQRIRILEEMLRAATGSVPD